MDDERVDRELRGIAEKRVRDYRNNIFHDVNVQI